jgi:hypothetical protein
MEILPPTYAMLSRWYPRLTDRARVLGVSRQTLTTWERDPGSARLRRSTARAIDVVASVTADVEDLVGSAAGAGAWMCVPQPLAGGQVPAAMARAGMLADVRRLMLAPTDATPVRRVQSQSRAAGSDLPAHVRRERPRSRGEALVLERIGEDPAVIGPVVD